MKKYLGLALLAVVACSKGQPTTGGEEFGFQSPCGLVVECGYRGCLGQPGVEQCVLGCGSRFPETTSRKALAVLYCIAQAANNRYGISLAEVRQQCSTVWALCGSDNAKRVVGNPEQNCLVIANCIIDRCIGSHDDKCIQECSSGATQDAADVALTLVGCAMNVDGKQAQSASTTTLQGECLVLQGLCKSL